MNSLCFIEKRNKFGNITFWNIWKDLMTHTILKMCSSYYVNITVITGFTINMILENLFNKFAYVLIYQNWKFP